MPIDTETPRSPGWWLVRLQRELELRTRGNYDWRRAKRKGRPGLTLLDDYVNGDPPLPHVVEGWGDAMRPFLRQCRLNVAELVVDCVRERMIPLGWSTSEDSNEDGDQVAARVSAKNDLDLHLGDVFGSMLALGHGYVILGPPEDGDEDEIPLITPEDPRQVITAEDPRTRKTIAALKMYRDDWDDQDIAYVYLPGQIWRATRGKRGSGYTGWEWDADTPEVWPSGFEDFVPVYKFENRRGIGEYEPHLDVLDRINDQIFSRVTVAKFQAFRQRAIKNLPQKDEHGRTIDYADVFTADPGALWQVPDGVDFWESQPIDLNPIRMATRDDIEHLAAVTRTPMYMITPDAAAGSAEGASTQREGLVYRVGDRRRRAEVGLARMMAGAFRIMGESARADVTTIKTLWQPAERFSLQERATAAAGLKASHALPDSFIWTDILQYGPADVPRLVREEAADLQREAERAALLEAAAQPPQGAEPADPRPAGSAQARPGGGPPRPGQGAPRPGPEDV